MASRAVGAMLALVAAVLLVASLASPVATTDVPAWFEGHPIVDGKVRVIQDVYVGPFGAAGCNERGCSTITGLDPQFRIVWFVEGGLVGFGALLALFLAIGTWRQSDRRKSVGAVALVVAIMCAAGAGVLIWQGPHLHASQTIEVPIGGAMFLLGGGVIALGIASVAALAARPQPLRLKPSHPRTIARATPPPEARDRTPMPAARGAPATPAAVPSRMPTPPPVAVPSRMPMPPAAAVPSRTPTPFAAAVPSGVPTPAPRAALRMMAEIPTLPALDATTADPRAKAPTLPPPTPIPDDRAKPPDQPPARATPNPPGKPATHPPPVTARTLPGLPLARPTPNPATKPATSPPPMKAVGGTPHEPPLRPTPSSLAKPITTPPANASPYEASNPPPGRPTPMPPRGRGPSVPPPARSSKATIDTPLRRSSPTIDPPVRRSNPTIDPPAGRSTPPTEPPARRSSPTIDPPIRRSNQTLSAIIPPPPGHAARASAAQLEAESADLAPLEGPRTSVEIDAAGKAAAKAAEAKRHDAQAARVAAEEEARRRSADQVRIAEAKRREADARAADNAAIAKLRGAESLPTDRADTGAEDERGEREDAHEDERQAELQRQRAPLTDDDLSTPRAEPSHDDARPELGRAGGHTAQIWGAAPPRVDAVKHAIKRAPSATPVEGVRADGKRATTEVIEQPMPGPTRSPSQVPISTASSSLPPPRTSSEPASGPTPACPQCESPMAWVEEHLRFYCKQCRMYF